MSQQNNSYQSAIATLLLVLLYLFCMFMFAYATLQEKAVPILYWGLLATQLTVVIGLRKNV